METQKCNKCGKIKPVSEFSWALSGKKRQLMCKQCFSEYNRSRYESKRDEIKKKVQTYRNSNPMAAFETRERAFYKNPNLYNLRKVTETAVKAGVLRNPNVCQNCGARSPQRRIEAHHTDYTKPLDVMWLCTPCHRVFDAKRREYEGKKAYSQAKKVRSMDKDGHFAKEYESISEAARDVGVSTSSISQALKSGGYSAGFRWEYL